MMKKKVCSFMLVAVMLVSMLSFATFSAAAEIDGVYTYTVEDDVAVILSCDKEVSGPLEIPEELGGYPVNEIRVCAFQNCKALTAVTIPESVVYIGDWAFRNCESLAEIHLPANLSVLGAGVFEGTAFYNDEENWSDGVLYLDSYLIRTASDFSGPLAVRAGITHIADFACDYSEIGICEITTVSLPDSIKTIGGYAFWFNSVSEINLPEGLQTIGDGAFMNCENLAAIRLPATLTKLGNLNFQWCPQLSAIAVDEENTAYTALEGALYNKEKTVLIKCPEAKETIEIPKGVTALETKAFRGCRKLKEVVLPITVQTISDDLFPHSNELEKIYYGGTQADREAMEIDPQNEILFGATWIYMFQDVPASHWAYDSVFYCALKGIMSGVEDGENFDLSGTMTRAALVSTIYRLEGSPAVSGNVEFTDVEEGAWYADAVLWASQNDIVSGKGDGTFAPTDPVTRASFVSILYRYSEYCGNSVSERADLSTFADAENVPNWAKANIEWAVAEGLLSGTPNGNKVNINYSGKATRAQGAVLLQKFCEM